MSKSPIAEAIYHIINAIRPNLVSPGKFDYVSEVYDEKGMRGKPFSVFSYRDDFSYLWSVEEDHKFGLDNFWITTPDYENGIKNGNQTISRMAKDKLVTLIVWEGFPQSNNPGDMHIENWITPIDWCVCAALHGYKIAANTAKSKAAKISECLPDWRVFVIDLASQNHLDSRSVSLLAANPAIIPWIRLYKPVLSKELLQWKDNFAAEDKDYALLRAMAKDDLTSLIDDIKSPDRVLGLNLCHGTLETLASVWSANIVRPGDRHQVANLVAPLILYEGIRDHKNFSYTSKLSEKIENQSTSALTQLLKNLELVILPKEGSGKKSKRCITQIQNKLLPTDERKQFILFDDQFELGFDAILRHIISTNADLTCHNSLDKIVEKLDLKLNAISKLTQKSGMGRQINTPGWRGALFDKPTIILLDLRFWANKAGIKKFHNTIKKLMKTYGEIIHEKNKYDSQRNDLNNDWLKVLEQIDARPEEENLLALTIIPRLISVIDPFQPVIIFSSSAQKETLQSFEIHPNIITTFNKPMPTGYGSKLDPSECIESLVSAIGTALEISQLRSIGERISLLEKEVFLGNKRIICEGFKNAADGEFDSKLVCNDLRLVSSALLRGNYRFAWALPYQLLECWYHTKNGKTFYDAKPMITDKYNEIAKVRHDFSHADKDKKSWENDDDDIVKAKLVWERLFDLLQLKV